MSNPTMPQNDNHRNLPLVSPVVGEGTDAHRLVRVGDTTLTVWQAYGDEEPRMLDVDVAKRLGFKRPRDIRQIIERIWPEGQRPCVRVTVQRTQMPTGGTRETSVNAYWLTEAQVLKVCARSETPVAESILDAMIAVYIAARRGLLAPAQPAAPALDTEALQRLIVETVAAQLRVSVPANLTLPVLDGRAKSVVLAKLMTLARTVAGLNAPQREVMRARGRIDRRVRVALNWSSRWCLYPTANLGQLLAALEAEERTAQQVADALARSRQLQLHVAPTR